VATLIDVKLFFKKRTQVWSRVNRS